MCHKPKTSELDTVQTCITLLSHSLARPFPLITLNVIDYHDSGNR